MARVARSFLFLGLTAVNLTVGRHNPVLVALACVFGPYGLYLLFAASRQTS